MRRSTRTSATAKASAAATNAMLVADPHAKRWPADDSQTSVLVAVSANNTMPSASGLPCDGCARSSPSNGRSRQSATAHSGRLTKNSHRQLAWWTTSPPSTGTADAREREDDREVGLVARTRARRNELADQRLRERHQATAAEALHDPRGDERAERRRDAARERAEREHDDRRGQELAPAEAIAEAPVERHHDHRREQIADREPRGVAQAAELAADHRSRRREQRLVDRSQEHRQHHREEEAPKARTVEAGCAPPGGRRGGAAALDRHLHRRSDQPRPVEPKPPPPRSLASNDATTRNSACTTGTTTSCAMRSNGSIVNGVWPRFQQLTISGPW